VVEALKNQEESRIILPNASWGTYERLQEEREERRYPRYFYDRVVLEISSPSAEHDRISRLIAALVELLAEEADTDIENAGSTTFKREDLSRGFEPDECFYFGSDAGRVRELVSDKGDIELDAGDPAPDLVVEVDIKSPSLDKLPIYARLERPRSLALQRRAADDLYACERRTSLRFSAGKPILAGGDRRRPHPVSRRRAEPGSPALATRGARMGARTHLRGLPKAARRETREAVVKALGGLAPRIRHKRYHDWCLGASEGSRRLSAGFAATFDKLEALLDQWTDG
jgi:Uma2 family endonuclease